MTTQGIETGTGETPKRLDPKDESPVRAADAQQYQRVKPMTLPIEPIDREAAAEVLMPTVGEDLANWANVNLAILAGLIDDHHLVQAFARHRIAERERCARVAENPGFIQARDADWDEGVDDAKRMIAHTIRGEEL